MASPSRSFHSATSISLDDANVLDRRLPPPLDPRHVCGRVALPRVFAGPHLGLGQAISMRRSASGFDPRAEVPDSVLSQMLALSCGITDTSPAMQWPGGRRAAPSAGARYGVDVHVVVRSVTGTSPGVYRYAHHDHGLDRRRHGDFSPALPDWTLGQESFAHAAFTLVLSGDINRLGDRYGERGYRYLLLECGHIAHNLCLLGTATGYGVQLCGGFVDDAINRLIGCDAPNVNALYLVGVGHPAPASW